MKSNIEILTKLEVMQEMKHNLAMKEEKTDFERLYIVQMESNIRELMWVLDMDTEFISDEEIKAKNDEQDILSEFKYETEEEPWETEYKNTDEVYN